MTAVLTCAAQASPFGTTPLSVKICSIIGELWQDSGEVVIRRGLHFEIRDATVMRSKDEISTSKSRLEPNLAIVQLESRGLDSK